MELLIKKILNRVTTICNKSAYITIDSEYSIKKDGGIICNYRIYVSNHIFKQSGSNFSNRCDSIEGFIEHINFEFKDFDGWKPIPQTTKGKRELANFKSITDDTRKN